jgi:hypothetical protein
MEAEDRFEILDRPRELEHPYRVIKWQKLEQRSKGSVSEIYLVENQETGEKFIRLFNRRTKDGVFDTFSTGFNIYKKETLSKVVEFVGGSTDFLEWVEVQPSDKTEEE